LHERFFLRKKQKPMIFKLFVLAVSGVYLGWDFIMEKSQVIRRFALLAVACRMGGYFRKGAGDSSWALLGASGAAYATGSRVGTAMDCGGYHYSMGFNCLAAAHAAEHYKSRLLLNAARSTRYRTWLKIVVCLTIVFFFFLYSELNSSVCKSFNTC
jgi:hypothetical protein